MSNKRQLQFLVALIATISSGAVALTYPVMVEAVTPDNWLSFAMWIFGAISGGYWMGIAVARND